MIETMKKHIPNLITLMNALSGALAIAVAMYGYLGQAALLLAAAMVFDFFDGMTARLLHVKSEMGKELDSLADMVSFGVAPAVLAHLLILQSLPEGGMEGWPVWTWGQKVSVFMPLVIPVCSACRLAKFNLDSRQATSFIGMPTPANALFWMALVFGAYQLPEVYADWFGKTWVLVSCAVILSVLLVSELPMFSLKISGWGWKENKIRYGYLILLLTGGAFWGKAVILLMIPFYILFAVIGALPGFTSSGRWPGHSPHNRFPER